MKLRVAATSLGLMLAILVGHSVVWASEQPLSVTEAYAIGQEGYDYLFPLVLMDITRRAQSTVPIAGATPAVPVNRLLHWQTFPKGEFRGVVRPNFDTLYSLSWIDVSKGPVTLSVKPDSDRYYLLPVMDMWTDVFAVPGSRTLGEAGGKFQFVSQSWRGVAPPGVEIVRAPTDMAWLISRIQTNGPEDYDHVHKLQANLDIQAAAPAEPVEVDANFNRRTPPVKLIATMTPEAFFAAAADLTGRYRPHDIDQPVVARLARIGFRPGQPFDLNKQPESVQRAVRKAALDEFASLKAHAGDAGEREGGWQYAPANVGAYGGDYHLRAQVALVGLGANRPEDAVYPSAATDGEGHPLIGANRYLIHFDKTRLPPAGAFWSLTAYDADGFPIQTPESRYAVGDRDHLKYNSDGSLDLYLGEKSPGSELQANWLPSGAQAFNVTLRIYLPKTSYFDRSWRAPPIVKLP